MRTLMFLLTLLLLSNCRKGDIEAGNSDILGSYYYDYHIRIFVVDDKGNDLLDPDNPKAYRQSDISLFYIDKNGKKEQNFDWTNYLLYHIDEGKYHNINFINLNCKYLNVIQWSQHHIDTIQPNFIAKLYGYTFSSVKVNGKTVVLTPSQPSDGPGLTLVK